MDPAARERIVTRLAEEMGLPVVLEDAAQQPIAYSPHHDLTDAIRRETILRRSTSEVVVDHFRPYRLPERDQPFVIPGDAARDLLPRLCVPIRHQEVNLGYLWVLLRSMGVTEAQLEAAGDARTSLLRSFLAEDRIRESETETVLDLVSGDPERGVTALTDVEARGSFPTGRRCRVLVCVGQAWEYPPVRTGFWGAGWAPAGQDQLRAVTEREGIVVFTAGTDHLGTAPIVAALARLRAVAREGERLVVGVGSLVGGPTQAPRAYRQARMAVRVALIEPDLPVASWDRLGTYRYLTQLPRELLADGVDGRVQRLVEEAPELAVTAEAYVQQAGAITTVAEALHIHRTTLYYRLRAIAGFGLDLGRGEDRTVVDVGLQALRLLGRWPAP
ncbi:MAG: hypothetical protein EA387_12495 [Nitriliruptor sp.]|nr:MAG: hypothetical protein EA387_12495 [Nitriliruptor sp.]